MVNINWDLFEIIFSDAHIIDLDFSEWDRLIRLVVESDHSEWINNRIPVFAVEFLDVITFKCNYTYPMVKLENPNDYCQWNIHDFRKEIDKSNIIEVKLISTGPGPDIILKCKNINFEQIEHRVIDKLMHNWDAPYSPLARRGIKVQYSMLSKK